jgi:hypothetical protein
VRNYDEIVNVMFRHHVAVLVWYGYAAWVEVVPFSNLLLDEL